jgi:hypothetical protein
MDKHDDSEIAGSGFLFGLGWEPKIRGGFVFGHTLCINYNGVNVWIEVARNGRTTVHEGASIVALPNAPPTRGDIRELLRKYDPQRLAERES